VSSSIPCESQWQHKARHDKMVELVTRMMEPRVHALLRADANGRIQAGTQDGAEATTTGAGAGERLAEEHTESEEAGRLVAAAGGESHGILSLLRDKQESSERAELLPASSRAGLQVAESAEPAPELRVEAVQPLAGVSSATPTEDISALPAPWRKCS